MFVLPYWVGIEMEIYFLEREKKKSATVITATAKVYLARGKTFTENLTAGTRMAYLETTA